jgi:hypothetical protein
LGRERVGWTDFPDGVWEMFDAVERIKGTDSSDAVWHFCWSTNLPDSRAGSDLSKFLQQRALNASEGFLEGLADDFHPVILVSNPHFSPKILNKFQLHKSNERHRGLFSNRE